ncbi:RNA cap guanine-N2 methyltransferase-domain-containing protein [Circinella umbellata]|nr:RNA cap guanine-N2 methyltransferase-domain-containing protein [Circinella umbellata]
MAYTLQSLKQWCIAILNLTEPIEATTCNKNNIIKKQQQQEEQVKDASKCLTETLLVESLDINATATATTTMTTTPLKTKPIIMTTKNSVLLQHKPKDKGIPYVHESIGTTLLNDQRQSKVNTTTRAAALVITDTDSNTIKTNIPNNTKLVEIDNIANTFTGDQEHSTTHNDKDDDQLSKQRIVIKPMKTTLFMSKGLASSSSSTIISKSRQYDEYYGHGYDSLRGCDNKHPNDKKLNETERQYQNNILYNNHLLLKKQNRRSSSSKKKYDTLINSISMKDEELTEAYYNDVIIRYTYYNLPSVLKKYYLQRYSYFTKYDQGILMDREGWFSVTPEKIARHIAKKCRSKVIIDAFAGCGGNTIQFALTCHRVIAIDIDPVKLHCARHNAKIYGVEDRIEFIEGDFFKLASKLKGDVIFLSPPWGGPSYKKSPVFDIETMIPGNGAMIYSMASKITPQVAFYVPRNTNEKQLKELAGPNGLCEIEPNFLNGRVKALTVYYGDLVDNNFFL